MICQVPPSSVENSTIMGEVNVEDRLMNQLSVSGRTPVKSRAGEVRVCAIVAFEAATQLGADRGALWLTAKSSPPVPRFLLDPQPEGSAAGEDESKVSA
jgi:hypothetical protein